MSIIPINILNYAFMSHLISVPTELTHTEVSRLASLAWEQAGKPAGRDLEFWLAAENQLRHASVPQETTARQPEQPPLPNSGKKKTTPKNRRKDNKAGS